jgi:hypothetical protein
MCLLVINRRGEEWEQKATDAEQKGNISSDSLVSGIIFTPEEVRKEHFLVQFIHCTVLGRNQNSTRNLMKKGSEPA